MIRAFRISQVVGALAQLGIPDRLAGGARTAGELASLTGCHAGATYRLMRAEARAFAGAMSVSSTEVAGEVARVLDTSSANRVVDVGGADGALISALLTKNPAYRSDIGAPRGRAARPICHS